MQTSFSGGTKTSGAEVFSISPGRALRVSCQDLDSDLMRSLCEPKWEANKDPSNLVRGVCQKLGGICILVIDH